MKILGIGNAIVDVLCKVSDEFLKQHSLTKSTMKLIDEAEFKKLLTSLKIEETISGGSVANSIVGLSQLGNEVGFIGKVSNDELGQKYENGLISEKVNMPFMDMWANINPPGTNVRPHNHYSPNHPNSLVRVYSLHKPTNSGNLIIEGEVIDIQEDDIIFFNDKDIHWTQKNKSNEDRITISFNML